MNILKASKNIGKNVGKFIPWLLLVLTTGILLKVFVFKGSTKKLVANCNPSSSCKPNPVVVLHGLVRSSASMHKISQSISDRGYTVCNVQYPSRQQTIKELATNTVAREIKQCLGTTERSLNFVTHSMGGIVVRQIAKSTDIKINRVVMLSPPNRGSELVDKLQIIPIFKFINGEAGLSLNTQPDSVPNTLGKVNFAAGIIIGNKSTNPLYSYLIPGEDDGKVSVERARVKGMQDFLVVPNSHSWIMNDDAVIEQTLNFLDDGKFARK